MEAKFQNCVTDQNAGTNPCMAPCCNMPTPSPDVANVTETLSLWQLNRQLNKKTTNRSYDETQDM